MQQSGNMSPKKVAETAPDGKMRFRDAFPFPGVIVIMGKRGSGKTATAMWVMEELHNQQNVGGAVFKAPKALRERLPSWVQTPTRIASIPANAVVIIDEAQQVANARRSASGDNLDLANLVALSRQRKQLIFLISHHSRKLDIVDVQDASRIIWKEPTAGQVMFERREIQPFCQRAINKFQGLKGNRQKFAYVMDFESLKFGFTQTKLPSFWDEEISSGMAGLGREFGI